MAKDDDASSTKEISDVGDSAVDGSTKERPESRESRV